MEKVLLVFLAIHLLKAVSQDLDFKGWLNIDCGSEQSNLVGNILTMPWSADVNFTKTGFNKQILARQALKEMNTLRFFRNRTQENCYIVPTTFSSLSAYIVRAGFLYGNYDGLSKPPTFDLKIDGQYWATVNTSSLDDGVPLYHEIIYVAHGAAIKVCMVETREGELPFISSLETMMIADPMYTEMVPYDLSSDTDPHAAFHLVTRTNFGGPEVRFGGIFDDYYNRIWTSGVTPNNCEDVSTWSEDFLTYENSPPIKVLDDSISTVNASDAIILTVDLPTSDGPHPAYFIFYFSFPEDDDSVDGVRITQIYINGQMQSTITFQRLTSYVVTIYPVDVVGLTINITLSPEPNSTLSTVLSGMEVFTRYNDQQPAPSIATSQLVTFMYVVLALALSFVAVF